MAQGYGTSTWWRLTPDAYGSYVDGTWTQLPPMPGGYAPYDYCSAVLADGRVVVEGGEYTYINGVASATETNQGAIYWISAGRVPVNLAAHGDPGPQILRPDGAGFAVGDNGENAVYTPPRTLYGTGSWAVAPSFPAVAGEGQLDACDGPAMLLTNGNILVGASPGCYNVDDHFFEFDGTHLTEVTQPPFGPNISSFWARLLMLPTGEVLATYDNRTAYIYSSTGNPDPKWAPRITACPDPIIAAGGTYVVAGRQLNGLSQAEGYGDDEAAASNYPLVRITNHATGHVFYARTHNHSSMGVATGSQTVSTHFDVPVELDRGANDLTVVTNGIASNRCIVSEPTSRTSGRKR